MTWSSRERYRLKSTANYERVSTASQGRMRGHSLHADEKSCIVSDDLKVRKIFQMLNFQGTEKLLDIMREEGIINEETYDAKNYLLQSSAFYSRKRIS